MAGIVSNMNVKQFCQSRLSFQKQKIPVYVFPEEKILWYCYIWYSNWPPVTVTIIHIDTGAEFSAVRSYIQKMKKLWKLNLIIETSGVNKDKGENKETCCKQYLFEPLKNIIKSRKFDGVLIGETSGSKMDISNFLSSDVDPDIFLAQPLISFTGHNIWEYIRSHNLPYCSLYEKCYPKIDCEPCSLLDTSPKNESVLHDEEALIKEKLKKLGYL